MQVPQLFSFLKSTRSIAVIIILVTLSIALFRGIINAAEYVPVAMVVIGSYFNKRSDDQN